MSRDGSGPRRVSGTVGLTLTSLSALVVWACFTQPGTQRSDEPSRASVPEVLPEPPADHQLGLGEPLEQVLLAGGESHGYLLALEPGDYGELQVEQQGIDVTLVLTGPDGDELVQTDSPNGSWGREELALVARLGGNHRLEIRAANAAAPGRYSLHWRARRLADDADHSRASALALTDRGEALRRQRRPEPSAEVFREALVTFESLGDRRRYGAVRLRLARCARAQGDLPRALDLTRRALEDLEAADDPALQADGLTLSGLLLFDLDRASDAIETWEGALALREAFGDTSGQAQLLHNQGHAHQLLGESQRALGAYERSLELRSAAGPRGRSSTRHRAETLHNLGALELSLGEDERGRRHLEDAIELWRGLGDDLARARSLDRLGLADLAEDEPDAAAGRFERALALRRSSAGGSTAAVSLANLGLARRHQGRVEEAVTLGREALELFLASGDRLGEARVRENLGHLERDLGRPQQAVAEHRRALELYRHLKDPAGESSALGALALDHRDLGHTDEALAAVFRALDLLETHRDQLDAAGHRRSFFASVAHRYDLAVELLLDRAAEDPAGPWALDALAVSERARARGLLEALAVPPSTRPATRLAEEASLSASLSAAARRRTEILAKAPRDAAALERAERRVEDLAHRLDRVRGELRQRRGHRVRETEPLQADELARWLAPGEILLEYRLGEEASHLWALTGDGEAPRLTTYRLPGRPVLEPLARRAHHLLSHSHRREVSGALPPVLCALQQLLIEPVAARLETRRILVAGDGPLHHVPFAALPDPRHAGPCEEAPPLVAAQAVVSSASLSARRAAAGRPHQATRSTLAVIADPELGDREPTLPSLPGTRREALQLAALSPEPAFVALGPEAHKELFTGSELATYRWIHLATHALIDDRRPELSALVLSAEDPGSPAPDAAGHARGTGRLFLHEIAGLDLHADLVTLSACRSALGEEVRGEGLVGLRGAFLEAGARRVLVSLWDVSDDSTAELMRRFYTALWRESLEPAEALRRAQISFLAEPRHRMPHHWAAFVLTD